MTDEEEISGCPYCDGIDCAYPSQYYDWECYLCGACWDD